MPTNQDVYFLSLCCLEELDKRRTFNLLLEDSLEEKREKAIIDGL